MIKWLVYNADFIFAVIAFILIIFFNEVRGAVIILATLSMNQAARRD